MNTFDVIDYVADAKGRCTEQFKEKKLYHAFLNIVLVEAMNLQLMFKDLTQLRSLNTATGAQLDIIGAIVGQPRLLLNFTVAYYFGFNGAFGAEPFGSVSNTNGGIFRSKYQDENASTILDDDTYRFIIKARIAANMSKGTPEDIIRGINYITGGTSVLLEEIGNAKLRITLPDNLTDLQKYFLQGLSSIGSIVPVPIGVSVEYVFV